MLNSYGSMIKVENNNLPILITKIDCPKCETVKKIIKNRKLTVRELDSNTPDGMAEIMYAELYQHDIHNADTPFLILPDEAKVVAGDYKFRVKDILNELSKTKNKE